MLPAGGLGSRVRALGWRGFRVWDFRAWGFRAVSCGRGVRTSALEIWVLRVCFVKGWKGPLPVDHHLDRGFRPLLRPEGLGFFPQSLWQAGLLEEIGTDAHEAGTLAASLVEGFLRVFPDFFEGGG